ncbi:MAG: hypothetical protein ACOYNS_08245 [Bacteroidota bacterium]
MTDSPLYKDPLVEISQNSIRFNLYYFPMGSAKTVKFSDVESITVERATISNGKWRIWGTGSLFTWFPCDVGRPGRDRIFFLKIRNKKVTIGWTVNDPDTVIKVLQQQGLTVHSTM